MNKIFKNKKIIFGLCILFFIFYFLSLFDFTSAQEFAPGNLPTGPDLLPRGAATAGKAGAAGAIGGAALSFLGKVGETAEWGVAIFGLLQVLYHLLFWIVTFAYGLLNSAVSMALNPGWFQIPAVLTAWQLVRDFVNVWFILIFLFIGIGTILRITNFQAKKLLPTMILVALVVNFSMPVSKFVIDTANIIAFQFLKSICEERVDPQSGNKTCDVSASLENALDAKIYTQVLQELPENPQQTPSENQPANNSSGANLLIPLANAQEPVSTSILTGYLIAQAVVGTISLLVAGWGAIQTYLGNSSILGVATKSFISILVSDIFLIVTAYVILSLAILFLIRTVTLLFLVILSPLGFVMTAVPGTQSYGKMWWDKLITQSFFAPFSLFFLWISIALMKSFKLAMETPQIAPYANYDVSNPANIRLIFYLFSLILLYASLWIARKMGAFGADTLMKWFGTARGAVTGFVGGLAARNLWAPLGAAGIAKGVPETLAKIPLVGPLAGITAAEALRKIAKAGKAPEEAAAKAELGMRLSPADRGAYFAKLDRAAKEAMLRKMKGEERNSFISDLATKDLTSAQEARAILRTAAFAPEERAKTELDEFKYAYTLPEQWKKFGSLSADLQKQFLLGIEDAEKRAQFLNQVKTEAEKNGDTTGLTAFQNANTFLETSSAFSANQQYANMIARDKVELTEAQKANRLAEFFASIPEKDKKTYFRFAANDSQRLELIEAAKTDPELLKEFQGWINLMDPADQDKFYRDSIGKRATADTVVAFVNAIDVKKKDAQGNEVPDEERNLAIKKMVLSGASVAQLAKVAQTSDPTLRIEIDKMADAMGARQRDEYYRRLGITKPPPLSGGPGPGNPPPTTSRGGSTPSTDRSPIPAAVQFVRTNNPTDIVAYLNTFDPEKDETVWRQAVAEIKSKPSEQQIEILRTLNPIIKIRYIDNISFTKEEEFITKLSQDIKKTERIDFKDQVFENPSIVSDSRFQQAFLRGGNIPKLLSLIREQPNAVKFIRDAVTKNMPTQDSELHAKAIEEKFGIEFRNHELAVVLSDIRRAKKETLNQTGKELKELFFE